MQTIEEINRDVLQLWSKTDPIIRGNLLPLLLSPLTPGALLFVGFNPSFAERFRKVNEPKFKYREPLTESEIKVTAEHDRASFHDYPYFKKMQSMAKEMNLGFEHLDLFFIRHTNQAEAEKKLLIMGKLKSRNQL